MFVIALHCLDLDVLCCYLHDYLMIMKTIEFLWCYWNLVLLECVLTADTAESRRESTGHTWFCDSNLVV